MQAVNEEQPHNCQLRKAKGVASLELPITMTLAIHHSQTNAQEILASLAATPDAT